MSSFKRFLLVGSPNTGKTTLFNSLTGLHQRTANYAGVTVEKTIGTFLSDGETFEIIDLPGIYSLYSESLDEQLAIQEILEGNYDGIILVANADQLQKNLLLILQVLDLRKPCVLVLNMIDEAQKKKVRIHTDVLSNILNVPIVSTNARTQEGINDLKLALKKKSSSNGIFHDVNIFNKISDFRNKEVSYLEWIDYYLKQLQHSNDNKSNYSSVVEEDLSYKQQLIKYITSKVVSRHTLIQNYSSRIDYYLTHKVWGFVFLILTLLIVFQVVFLVAEYPMQWIEWGLSNFSRWIDQFLPPTEWANLIVNGVIPGITGVVMFVPQIALLFLMIGILEESGYMARISFLLDSVFRQFGLSGKSLIPLVSGTACAVPSILSTRTITNVKEKIITIMVLPFMSCSARLPVYTMLISLIFPENTNFGFLNLKGLMLLGMYLFGLVVALLYAWIFHKLMKQNQRSFFFIELPSYKVPYWKNLFINVWNKVKIFILDAGKIIMAISIVLWYLSAHTFPSIQKELERKYAHHLQDENVQKEYQRELLEQSYVGIIGKKIEPIIAPLGYDWKIGIALVTSFAAREVFVGTMATLYSAESEDDLITLTEKIQHARKSNGEYVFSTATCVSLLVYYALAMQCISTMVVVYRELRSIKWMILQFLIMSGTAYVLSFVVYQLLV
ncbi:MAG: ferrous iron transport protein B [Bacteroidia bacterium]|nr:MAG: ferrous iron transport protein B [Bacteroidia bacterium]